MLDLSRVDILDQAAFCCWLHYITDLQGPSQCYFSNRVGFLVREIKLDIKSMAPLKAWVINIITLHKFTFARFKMWRVRLCWLTFDLCYSVLLVDYCYQSIIRKVSIHMTTILMVRSYFVSLNCTRWLFFPLVTSIRIFVKTRLWSTTGEVDQWCLGNSATPLPRACRVGDMISRFAR